MRGGADADHALGIEGIDILPSRTISQTVALNLEVAVDALEHYAKRNTLSGFTNQNAPISYEAVQAIKHIAEGADCANITITWDTSEGDIEVLSGHDYEQEFHFNGGHVPVLERAAVALAQPQPSRHASARGVVHLLSRSDAGGPGVIGIMTPDGEPAKKVRVHLSNDDYVRALHAHENGRLIRVSGSLEKEGNLSYLYNARLEHVYEEDESPKQGRPTKRVSTEDDQGLFDA